ncbi:FprA family A-type flavoprotein [Anaerotalea alkaliphila]|uniref:FprA family A-type flavoprotein n=1 Tax=Anaerotalea alkaliphila TaxID=2662126 RepID=A0A7X5KN12_9FIRM|nr:FprA family A-type flavoprotein [Anaerotalea alkaliphila]NDL68389.1 FprA family A-type flavoprotein [Anaerotalea alkaliphila]
MKTIELKKGVSWIGVQDHDLRVFDVIMLTEFGTSYNSYLVEGTEKTALVETVKLKFWDAYLEKLKQTTDLKKIDYLVVNHTEPDHVGSVEKLLELIPDVTIVGSAAAIKFLKGIANKEFKSMVVTGPESLDLGGKTLKFIQAPFLHWPDSIYTYLEEDKTLFTCDSFGAHYAFDGVLLSKLEDRTGYHKALRYYFDMIFGPFKPYMLAAIEKIQNLDLDLICTGHGPVLDVDPMEIVELSRQWATEENPNPRPSIVVPYVSAYGYTEMMAKEIRRAIAESYPGKVDVHLYDLVTADMGEVMDRIYWADGLLFGSPTINSDVLPPIWNLLVSLNPIVHGKKHASAFGSYGWSGEAVKNIEARLKQLRFKVTPGLKIVFKPNPEELLETYRFGQDFAKTLLDDLA